ncbi:predicted protein [Chaetoceros tenuissimus]|uniref:Uncharacterized protein n=1 Tax=Chaetoceros tenuissimus TaxID=426638 RepID=A0AAD3D2N2_9STRA|nr:predicted protein [Chaetoceros tenuissimus]
MKECNQDKLISNTTARDYDTESLSSLEFDFPSTSSASAFSSLAFSMSDEEDSNILEQVEEMHQVFVKEYNDLTELDNASLRKELVKYKEQVKLLQDRIVEQEDEKAKYILERDLADAEKELANRYCVEMKMMVPNSSDELEAVIAHQFIPSFVPNFESFEKVDSMFAVSRLETTTQGENGDDEEYLEIANGLLHGWRKEQKLYQALFEKKVVVSSDETTLDLTEVPLRRKSKARKYMGGKVLQKVSVYSIRKLVWFKKCFKKRKNLKRLYEVVDDANTTDLCESTISNENENVMESSQECKSTKEILGDAHHANHEHILKAHACIIDQANTIKNLRMEVANISNANVYTTSSSDGDSFFSAFDDGFSIDA